jgi:hypothetical protein
MHPRMLRENRKTARARLRLLGLLAAVLVLLSSGIAHTATTYDEAIDGIYLSTNTPEPHRSYFSQIITERELRRKIKEDARTRAMIALHGTSYGVAAIRKMNAPPAARKQVNRDLGGEVQRLDHAAVKVPAGALSQTLDLTVSHPPEDSRREQAATTAGNLPASLPVAFGPEGTVFITPVKLTIPFDATLLKAMRIRESDLKIHYWNSIAALWEPLTTYLDSKNGTATANVSHFSTYQIFGTGGYATSAAIDEFQMRNAYAFPNPVRGLSTVTIRVQTGPADSIVARIYDLAGRKIHESSLFSGLGAFDDGNGLGPQFTFDHVWDVSGVGSGVYTFSITAKKAGLKDILKNGKIGVIK